MFLLSLLTAALTSRTESPKTGALKIRLGLLPIQVEFAAGEWTASCAHGRVNAMLIEPGMLFPSGPRAHVAALVGKRPLWMVYESEVDDSVAGTGIGLELYLSLLRAIAPDCGVLVSNNGLRPDLLSGAAARTWTRLLEVAGVVGGAYDEHLGEEIPGYDIVPDLPVFYAWIDAPVVSAKDVQRMQKAIDSLTRSKAAYTWIDDHPETSGAASYHAGGCWPLASAIAAVLGPQAELWQVDGKRSGQAAFGPQHVFVRVGSFALDANGATPFSTYAQHYADQELLDEPVLRSLDPLACRAADIPEAPALAARLEAALRARLRAA